MHSCSKFNDPWICYYPAKPANFETEIKYLSWAV